VVTILTIFPEKQLTKFSLNEEVRGGNCLLVPERSYGPDGHCRQSAFLFYDSEIGNRKTTVFLYLLFAKLKIGNRSFSYFLFYCCKMGK